MNAALAMKYFSTMKNWRHEELEHDSISIDNHYKCPVCCTYFKHRHQSMLHLKYHMPKNNANTAGDEATTGQVLQQLVTGCKERKIKAQSNTKGQEQTEERYSAQSRIT
jgi:hypothetical protein